MKTLTKNAVVTIPLSGLRCLYRNPRSKRVVCELDISLLKKINDPTTIDEMVTEARLEHLAGKTRKFTSTRALVAYLRS